MDEAKLTAISGNNKKSNSGFHATGADNISNETNGVTSTKDSPHERTGKDNTKQIGNLTLEEIIEQFKQSKKEELESSSSCFDSSSEDDLFTYNNKRTFIPLYRKEHGGIVIYDCDANIPGQPPDETEYSDDEDLKESAKKLNKNGNGTTSDIFKPLLSPDAVKKLQRSNSCILESDLSDQENKYFWEDSYEDQGEHEEVKSRKDKLKSPALSELNDVELFINSKYPDFTKSSIKDKKPSKDYGVNEVPLDNELLNKKPKFSKLFEQEIMRNIKKKKRYDKTNHRFLLRIPNEDEMKVRFESRFESGNLKKAIKVSDTQYNLWLNYDFNTRGHTQWFYFKIITKLPKGTKLDFSILNLMKPDSLYNYGMKP